eukprot:GFUD01001126.1.p1 GENE.GFUD01001126.1~~GFUD01001126.1.p1  ORF type:complete len:653 (+),score=128.14 GFUD01001126.1:144-2102(+)
MKMTRKNKKKGKNPTLNTSAEETNEVLPSAEQETELQNENMIPCQVNELLSNECDTKNSSIEEPKKEVVQNQEKNDRKPLSNDKDYESCSSIPEDKNTEKLNTQAKETLVEEVGTLCQDDKLSSDQSEVNVEDLVEKEKEKLPTHVEEQEKRSEKQEENTNIGTNKSLKSSCCICGGNGQRCIKCKNVILCDNCLPRHFHVGRCLPWSAKDVIGSGRCLVATRSIKPLEVVIEDSAVITVPVRKMSCVGCGRGVNCAYSCPSCLLPLCGSGCPGAESHTIECPLLKGCLTEKLTLDDKNHTIFTAVGCIRFLQIKTKEPEKHRKLANLDPQTKRINSDPLTSKLLRDIKEMLKSLNYREEEIEYAYGLIKLYGYNLPDVPDGKVRSLFPVQSLLSHSCLPNLQYFEKEGGRKIVLQSTTQIEKGDILTVRYTPFLQGRITLTKWLNEQRYIECKCPRCVDATELGTFTSSALCDREECKERGGLLLPVDPINRTDWICSACQTRKSQAEVEEIEENYIAKFKELPQGDLNGYYKFLNELGDRFHASHHLVMRMAQFLVLLQGKRLESLSRERIETQSVLCDKLLAYVSRLDPGATQNRAKLLLEKNKADLNLAKLDCEAGLINRKVFMAKIKEGVRVEVNAKKILYFKWDNK